jgi:hypothetical protein
MLSLLDEQTKGLISKAPADNKFQRTAEYLAEQITGEDYTNFLTE